MRWLVLLAARCWEQASQGRLAESSRRLLRVLSASGLAAHIPRSFMTNETVFLGAFVLSVLTVVAYLICKRRRSELKESILIFLSCSGVLTGIQICCLTLDTKIDLGALKDYKLYLVIGGFSVIWLSIATIFKCFQK